MSACSGDDFWPLLITIFLGNHHNNQRNSLLWPITQTRREWGDPKNSRLESNGRGKSQVVLGIMDVLVEDVVGGEGAAVGVGRIEGLPRHPTLQSLYSTCPCVRNLFSS